MGNTTITRLTPENVLEAVKEFVARKGVLSPAAKEAVLHSDEELAGLVRAHFEGANIEEAVLTLSNAISAQWLKAAQKAAQENKPIPKHDGNSSAIVVDKLTIAIQRTLEKGSPVPSSHREKLTSPARPDPAEKGSLPRSR
jgi:hypothetical protein